MKQSIETIRTEVLSRIGSTANLGECERKLRVLARKIANTPEPSAEDSGELLAIAVYLISRKGIDPNEAVEHFLKGEQ